MLKYIDLFAGCGGLSEGFEDTGSFELVAACEWEQAPVDTFRERLRSKWRVKKAKEKVVHFDIQRLEELFLGWSDDVAYGSSVGLDKIVSKEVDLVIGGPPCQAYSIAGRIRDANGMKDDYRNFLFESYISVVERYRPKVILFENVLGMLSANLGGVLITDRIRKSFSDIGYEIIDNIREHAVLDASDFGVPQIRKRVILIAIDREKFKNPQKTLLNFYNTIVAKHKVNKKTTVKDAIYKLPLLNISPDDYKVKGKKRSHLFETTSKLSSHVPRYHNRRDIKIFAKLAQDIISGKREYVTTVALQNLYTQMTGNSSNIHKYKVLEWDKPSSTIVAHLYKDGLRHIHPDPKQGRSITVREAARLQSFSDDFEFKGSQSDQYKMIGNAVPPILSKILAESILELYK